MDIEESKAKIKNLDQQIARDFSNLKEKKKERNIEIKKLNKNIIKNAFSLLKVDPDKISDIAYLQLSLTTLGLEKEVFQQKKKN